MDVDYKAAPVQDVYGITANATIWRRIDHCLFDEVRNVYRATEMVTDPEYCMTGCNIDCYGVNVVPLRAPSTAHQGFTERPGDSWMYPSVYGADIYVPWNHSIFNNTRDKFISIASEDRYMCYSVQPKQFTDTEDEYKVTNDPQDPVFYSTCYYRFAGNIFPEYLNQTSDIVNVPWRYFDKCIDCETKAKNTNPVTVPKWYITDTCVDCNLEPGIVRPFVPILIQNGSRCDGLSGTWRVASHYNCTNASICVSQLVPIGRAASANIDVEECAVMAANDPTCSKYYFTRNVTNTWRCYCYANTPCCQTCSRVTDALYNLYETTSTPDPTCAGGVLSANSAACCTASCGAGNCTTQAGNHPATGMCCSTCSPRSCAQYGPPCFL
jgi:hypothetical protein